MHICKRVFLFSLFLFVVPALAHAADTYKVDSGHSSVVFQLTHLNLSNFYGRFNDTDGTIVYDPANPAKSSVRFTIKTESVDTNSAKRDQHLKGPDFFNAKQFPVIQFVSKSVKTNKDGSWAVSGELTMLGVARPLTVSFQKVGEGKDPWGGYRMGFEARFTLKRSDFGMKYGLGGIGDEVHMIVSVEAVKAVEK